MFQVAFRHFDCAHVRTKVWRYETQTFPEILHILTLAKKGGVYRESPHMKCSDIPLLNYEDNVLYRYFESRLMMVTSGKISLNHFISIGSPDVLSMKIFFTSVRSNLSCYC